MQFSFNCSACNQPITATDKTVGKLAPCPHCKVDVQTPPAHVGPGVKLGSYQIVKQLGRGGMGEVYLAEQLATGRKVAVKVLPEDSSYDQGRVQRFQREVRLGAKLEHPNIVAVFDAGEDAGFLFLVMSYVEGKTLEQVRGSQEKLSEEETLMVGRQTAGGLLYAWERCQILHRDIKPANLMQDVRGEIKILDLGLAKSLLDEASMTVTGVISGTPYYMSPEQCTMDAELDFHSDIYSLGATMFHLLAGRPPFMVHDKRAIMRMHVMEARPDIREFNPAVSEGTSKLLMKMMARKPAERQTSWLQVIEEITALQSPSQRLRADLSSPALRAVGPSGDRLPSPSRSPNAAAAGAPSSWRQRLAPLLARVGLAPATEGAGTGVSTTTQSAPSAAPRLGVLLLGLLVGTLVAVGALYGIKHFFGNRPEEATRPRHSAPQPVAGDLLSLATAAKQRGDWAEVKSLAAAMLSARADDAAGLALQRESTAELAVAAATAAEKQGDWVRMKSEAEAALAVRPEHARALALKQAAVAELALAAAVAGAETAKQHADWSTVKAQAEAALALRPGHARSLELKHDADVQLAAIAALITATAARDAGDWVEVQKLVGVVFAARPGDGAATALKKEADSEMALAAALAAAAVAAQDHQWGEVKKQAALALAIHADNAPALAYKQAAEQGLTAAASQSAAYTEAMAAAAAAKLKGEWAEVKVQAEKALAARPADAPALALQQAAAGELAHAGELAAALAAAAAAKQKGDWAEVQKQAGAALVLRPGHPPALALKQEADTALTVATTLAAAEAARKLGHWPEVLAQANAVLAAQPENTRAKILRQEADLEVAAAAAQAAAEAARTQGTWVEARTAAEAVLALRADEPRGLTLKKEADIELTAVAALAAATAAKRRGAWGEVRAQATAALAIHPADATALALRKEADAEISKVAPLPLAAAHPGQFPADLLPVPDATYPSVEPLAEGSKEAQVRQQQAVQPGKLPLEVRTAKTAIALRLVPAGTFVMGSPAAESGREATEVQHEVTLSRPYYCGKYEVTQGQWEAVMGTNPSYFGSAGKELPVESVSWDDCQTFLQKLCEKEGVPAGTYRLLTEAEWEYACRAGATTATFGDLDAVAWHDGNSGRKTHQVGQKLPNAFGLYDLLGNVFEWCNDVYGTYPREAVTNPTGPANDALRVTRGGGCNRAASRCRAASRAGEAAGTTALFSLGLRLARNAP